MMNPKKVGILAVALLALSAAAFVVGPQDPKPLSKPVVTYRGEHSKVDELRYLKITDEESWVRLWCEHTGQKAPGGGYGFYNERQIPLVDFEQCLVVAVFGGKQGNIAGYRVEQVLDGEQLTVKFDANGYQTSIIDPDNYKAPPPSTPFGMFVLPKTQKKIRMEENVQSRINQPPKWKLRATL